MANAYSSTSPAQPSPPGPDSGPVRLGDLLPNLGMRLVYDGPIPPRLLCSLERVAPPSCDVRYLYAFHGTSGCVYIGQTYKPASRIVAHRRKSRFWKHVNHLQIYRHEYAGIWPDIDGEIMNMERQAIADLVPIYNLDRPLSEADRGAPWEEALRRQNRDANIRALRLLERGA